MAVPLVLLVEDDTPLADLLIEVLAERHYRVVPIPHRLALLQARRLRPSLVLLDLQGSTEDSRKITMRLRGDPVTSGIPIVAMTPTADRDDYPGLIADELLRLPFRMDELLASMTRWIAA